MTVGIYSLYDVKTNECLYVGQSKNCEERFKNHKKLLRNKKHRRVDFIAWFQDYGEDRLGFKILEECEDNDYDKNKLEIYWFNELQPKFYGLKPSMNGKWTVSEETREKIRGIVRNYLGGELISDIERTCVACGATFKNKKRPTSTCSVACGRRLSNGNKKTDLITAEELSYWYYDERKTLQEVGEIFKVSGVTISILMDKYGLERRGRGKAQ